MNRGSKASSCLLTTNLLRRRRKVRRRPRWRALSCWIQLEIAKSEGGGASVPAGSAAGRDRWERQLSSNHREGARFVSLRHQRQLSRRAHRALVPSPKLFAVTFFSAISQSFFACLIAPLAYGFARPIL